MTTTATTTTFSDQDERLASRLVEEARSISKDDTSPSAVWAILHQHKLSPSMSFEVHRRCYEKVYEEEEGKGEGGVSMNIIKPTWIPSLETIQHSNISKMMMKLQQQAEGKGMVEKMKSYQQFYEWSIHKDTREDFWMESVNAIGIQWERPPQKVFFVNNDNDNNNDNDGIVTSYFPDATLNIADSCFTSATDDDAALIYNTTGTMESQPRCCRSSSSQLETMSFGELDSLSNKVANALSSLTSCSGSGNNKLGLQAGDAVAICMPMTPECIALYLGIIKMGGVVISIADSFSSDEIATRCRLGQAKAVFTQDVIYRTTTTTTAAAGGGASNTKFLPLYSRVLQACQQLMEDCRCNDSSGPNTNNNNNEEQQEEDAKETKSDSEMTTRTTTTTRTTMEPIKIVVLSGLLHARPCNGDDDDDDDNGEETDEQNKATNNNNNKNSNINFAALHESIQLREGLDWSWDDFLRDASETFTSIKRSSMDPCNILFSSGTTGEPKAIVWSHSTPIKCAIDGYYHQDIHAGDRVVWPTNVGWMMGPWLIYQLIHGATIGLFHGVASTPAFCEFVEKAQISMVGVIPSIVKAWQAKDATRNCDWSCVKKFSSTGEASDPVNYHWLVSRVPGYAPVMEYCGGTEIGGSFLSSTMVQPNVPSMFSSPVLGSQIMILDHEGQVIDGCDYTASHNDNDSSCLSGEIALVPPSLGLSTQLLNRDHYTTYYKGMNKGPRGEVLRRHGDEIEQVRSSSSSSSSRHYDHPLVVGGESSGTCSTAATTTTPYYRALGRCDDTMNIGGIKVGSIEIERVCNLIENVQETAAIAVSSGPNNNGGPSELVLYVVLRHRLALEEKKEEENSTNTTTSSSSMRDANAAADTSALKKAMQQSIKNHLNPLFRISDVVVTTSLPRTASNKVMRRLLRDEYIKRKRSIRNN